jgi:hypothetical protein
MAPTYARSDLDRPRIPATIPLILLISNSSYSFRSFLERPKRTIRYVYLLKDRSYLESVSATEGFISSPSKAYLLLPPTKSSSRLMILVTPLICKERRSGALLSRDLKTSKRVCMSSLQLPRENYRSRNQIPIEIQRFYTLDKVECVHELQCTKVRAYIPTHGPKKFPFFSLPPTIQLAFQPQSKIKWSHDGVIMARHATRRISYMTG